MIKPFPGTLKSYKTDAMFKKNSTILVVLILEENT